MNGHHDHGIEEDLGPQRDHRADQRADPDHREKEVQPQVAELCGAAQPAHAR